MMKPSKLLSKVFKLAYKANMLVPSSIAISQTLNIANKAILKPLVRKYKKRKRRKG